MSRKPTMEDVKNLAGVSISTVSRVINKTRKVSPDKTEAVNNAIEKLGYKPNELARSLVMKRSKSLGIILDDIGYGYMAQILRGIDEVGKMKGFDILLYSTFADFEIQKKAVDFLSTKQVEGIIVISEKINNEILYLIKEHEIPYIILDQFYDPQEYTTISIDYKKAMYEMTKHFIDNNHKNIAYIRDKSSFFSTEAKESGYQECIEEYNLDESIFNITDKSVKGGYAFLEKNINKLRENNITGIIADSDLLAVGMLHYCYDYGINIPEEFSISGFGDTDISELFKPSITTIRLPYYDIGAVAVSKMVKVLREDEKFNQSINLNHHIVERETVKKI